MKVTLSEAHGCYLLTAENGQDRLIQTDWDYPGLASSFGFCPCDCGATDGTIDCEHKTASEMISAAAAYLDDHIGETIDDPGYFDGEEWTEPQEEDYQTSDYLAWYQSGKRVLTLNDNESWPDAIKAHMDANGFFPNCWFIGERGEANLLDLATGTYAGEK